MQIEENISIQDNPRTVFIIRSYILVGNKSGCFLLAKENEKTQSVTRIHTPNIGVNQSSETCTGILARRHWINAKLLIKWALWGGDKLSVISIVTTARCPVGLSYDRRLMRASAIMVFSSVKFLSWRAKVMWSGLWAIFLELCILNSNYYFTGTSCQLRYRT